MQAEIRVGPQLNQDGAVTTARAGRSGELCVTDTHGRYAEAALRGNLFCAATQASGVYTAIATTSATGQALTNPAGSGKNLVVYEICMAVSAAVTAVADFWVGTSISTTAAAITQTAALSVRNCLLGNPTIGVGLSASQYTQLATNVAIRPLLGWHWVTGGTPTTQLFVKDEVAGALILTPGAMIGLYSLTATHSAISSITWEEVPIY